MSVKSACWRRSIFNHEFAAAFAQVYKDMKLREDEKPGFLNTPLSFNEYLLFPVSLIM